MKTLAARAETVGKTRVKMEALYAMLVDLLTVYDMRKAVDRGMVMSNIRVMESVAASRGIGARRVKHLIYPFAYQVTV